MGQYYDILINQDNKYYHSDRSVDGKYEAAKLMEHSWFENDMLKCICSFIYKKPSQVFWVGDYADNVVKKVNTLSVEKIKEIYNLTYCNKEKNVETLSLTSDNQISLKDRFLVNRTKKFFIDGNKYFDWAQNKYGWCTHPLSLLTALGNGQGGGDYFRRESKDKVGAWAGDLISVEDKTPLCFEDKTSDYIFIEKF